MSAWLILPFFAGAQMSIKRAAGLIGFLACGSELAGYYLTAHLRGLSAGGNIVIFWLAGAALGGTIFGVAGSLWRHSRRLRGLGAAMLPASFLGEGLWSYAHKLRYYSDAVLWILIGVSLAVALNRRSLQSLGWLALTLPAAIAGEIALTAAFRQPF